MVAFQRLNILRLAVPAAALLPAAAMAQAAALDSSGDGLSLSQIWFKIFSWVQDQQHWFDQNTSGAIEKLTGADPFHAGLLLAGFSFLYGVFHAIGPGHGKAIISSYVLANKHTLRRGIIISFIAGVFQALTAIVIVSIFSLLFHYTRKQVDTLGNNLETYSYAAITLLGVWWLFRQIRQLFRVPVDHHHEHAHDHGADAHNHHGHAHLPGAKELEGASWSKSMGIAALVGLRPCTGALIIMGFAISQGLFWAGVAATLVMGLGTAITVSALATIAIASRATATRFAGASELWIGRIETLAKLGGGVAMVAFGGLFFLASLHPHPFG